MKIIITLISTLIILASCKSNQNNPVSPTPPSESNGNIKIGIIVDLLNQTIGSGGGTIKINKPGDPLDGFELTVPPNSFSQPQTFKISYAPITSHQLGHFFNPITPMIKITNQGGYSNKTITIKIPIKLQTNRFAMGFFYNEKSGKLEGIPLEKLDNNNIVIATRYFSPNTDLSLNKLSSSDILSDLIIGDLDESVLNSQTIVDTGFKPGIDDWEFINFGSYVEPGGICAGQSLTAMWYYVEKKRTDGALFHRLDLFNDKTKPGKLWQDNPRGYRFATTIHSDLDWDNRSTEKLFQEGDPVLTWKTFAFSMLITKEPQYVTLRKSGGGHAVIAYQMNYQAGELLVADPNYPANYAADGTTLGRVIKFRNNKFEPFSASLKADTAAALYDTVYYFGKTTMIDWAKFSRRWSEVQAGTIGNNLFPSYTLYVNNTSGEKLQDGFISTTEQLEVVSKSTDAAQFLIGTDHLQVLYVYDQNGNQLARGSGNNKGIAKVKLNPGSNKLGFYICGAKNNKAENYVDFKWINVNYLGMTIDPDSLNAEVNKEYTFTAKVVGTPPASSKYVWNFDDGTPEVTQTGSNTAKHTFTKEGIFNVTAKLFDNTTNKQITIASSTVYIVPALVKDIIKSYQIYVSFGGKFNTDNNTIKTLDGFYINGSWRPFSTQNILWSGFLFIQNISYRIPTYNQYGKPDTIIVTGSISGTISQDGKTVTRLSGLEKRVHTSSEETSEAKIEISNLPYSSSSLLTLSLTQYQYWSYGLNVINNISSVSYKRKLWFSNRYETVNSTSAIYDSNSTLGIYFVRKN